MQDSNEIYEAKLREQMQNVQECQQERSLNSCYTCTESIGCEIRTRYVRSVYESMSKGETGGFDF